MTDPTPYPDPDDDADDIIVEIDGTEGEADVDEAGWWHKLTDKELTIVLTFYQHDGSD